MTGLERFLKTVNRETVDRPASWLGLPTSNALPSLLKYFDVKTEKELRVKLEDDIYPVELPYHSESSNAIYAAFDFAKDFEGNDEERTLTAPGFFEEYDDPSMVNDFNWPEPDKYIDSSECRRVIDEAPKDMAIMGVVWSAHFQDTCAAFGMETALVKMLTEPEMYHAVNNKIIDFYLKANEIFYEATKGKLHAVLIGNDLGSQTGLMLSPDMIREFVLPGTRKFVEQAKGYGLTVIHHSCGAIHDIIHDLIGTGVDVIHPIQALAKGMEPKGLRDEFADKVSFCGGVDAQNLLVNGTPKQVREKIFELKSLFPTGLIISPSHEAILPDIHPENIKALFDAIKE